MKRGPIAQLVEHLTFNQVVASSNLAGLTIVFQLIINNLLNSPKLIFSLFWRRFESGLKLLFVLRSSAECHSFEGLACVFCEEDLGKDIIDVGAFAECLDFKGSDGIRMLFQHDPLHQQSYQ